MILQNFNLLNFTSAESSVLEQAAQAAAPIAALAAISPPPLNIFPPQGAPQPGAVTSGGGVTPATALQVRILDVDCTSNIINFVIDVYIRKELEKCILILSFRYQ